MALATFAPGPTLDGTLIEPVQLPATTEVSVAGKAQQFMPQYRLEQRIHTLAHLLSRTLLKESVI